MLLLNASAASTVDLAPPGFFVASPCFFLVFAETLAADVRQSLEAAYRSGLQGKRHIPDQTGVGVPSTARRT